MRRTWSSFVTITVLGLVFFLSKSATGVGDTGSGSYHVSKSPELDFFLHREASSVSPPTTLRNAASIKQLIYSAEQPGLLVSVLYNNGCMCLWNVKNCTECYENRVHWMARLGKTTLIAVTPSGIRGINQATGVLRWESEFDLATSMSDACTGSRYLAFYADPDVLRRSWLASENRYDTVRRQHQSGLGGVASAGARALFVAVFDIKNNQGLVEIIAVPLPRAGSLTTVPMRPEEAELDLLACSHNTVWITRKEYSYYDHGTKTYLRASALYGIAFRNFTEGQSDSEIAESWKRGLVQDAGKIQGLKLETAILSPHGIQDICLTENIGVATLNTGHLVAWGCNHPGNPFGFSNAKHAACKPTPGETTSHLAPASLASVHVLLDPRSTHLKFSGKLACTWSESQGLRISTRETSTGRGQILLWSSAMSAMSKNPMERFHLITLETVGQFSGKSQQTLQATDRSVAGFMDNYRLRLQSPTLRTGAVKQNVFTVARDNKANATLSLSAATSPGVAEDASEPGDATDYAVLAEDIVLAVSISLVFAAIVAVMFLKCDVEDPRAGRAGLTATDPAAGKATSSSAATKKSAAHKRGKKAGL